MTHSAELARYQEAIDALKIQNAATALALRYDPLAVMRVMRGWLDYMDRQVALIDGLDDAGTLET